MYCRCKLNETQSRRHNPDEKLRELERRAHVTGDNADWDAYMAVFRRSGEFDRWSQEVITRFHVQNQSDNIMIRPAAGEVTRDEYLLLGRYLNFQYRYGILSVPTLESLVRYLNGDDMLRGIIGLPPTLEPHPPESQMPSDSQEGYFWFTFTPFITITEEMQRGAPQWVPIRLLSLASHRASGTPGEVSPWRWPGNRIRILCPICSEEVALYGSIIRDHLQIHSPTAQRTHRPIKVVKNMLNRRVEALVGSVNKQHADITTRGHGHEEIRVRALPELIHPIQDYLVNLGLVLLASGPDLNQPAYSIYIFGYPGRRREINLHQS